MADSFTAFPGRRPFGTQNTEQRSRVCSYGHPLPEPRNSNYLNIGYNRTQPPRPQPQPPRLTFDTTFRSNNYIKKLEPYGVCKECDRIHMMARYAFEQSRAAASQNPPFSNNPRTRFGSNVPSLGSSYQPGSPWRDRTAAGPGYGPLDPFRIPPSRRNDDFLATARATSTASSSSRSSYSDWTNPSINRQNYPASYPFQVPASRRATDFSDTASIFSTTSSSSRSSYRSWDRA